MVTHRHTAIHRTVVARVDKEKGQGGDKSDGRDDGRVFPLQPSQRRNIVAPVDDQVDVDSHGHSP